VPGLSADEYLRQSIIDPDAYMVLGCPAGQMLEGLGEVLSDQELDGLVAFMRPLTGRSGTPRPGDSLRPMRNVISGKRRIIALTLTVIAAACGGGGGSDASDEASQPGKELFAERILGPNAGCITCHSLDADTILVGPSVAGIGTRAAGRRPGVAAEDYLRESIVDPAAYVVEGFDDGRMPVDWAEALTGAEIDALVAYLLTLR
jgi:nitric oxide reductase subunit C